MLFCNRTHLSPVLSCLVGLTAILFVSGCGDDVLLPPTRDAGRDVPARDVPNVDGVDGAVDVPSVDGAMDAVVDGGPLPTCEVVAELDLLGDATASNLNFDLAASDSGFLLSWTVRAPAFDNVFTRTVATDGTLGDVQQLTEHVAATARQPTAVAVSDGWLLYYVDNSDHGFELWVRRLAPDGSPRGAARRLTDNRLDEQFPLAVVSASAPGAIWSQQDGGDPPILVRADVNVAEDGFVVPSTFAAESGIFGRVRVSPLGEGVGIAGVSANRLGLAHSTSDFATVSEWVQLSEDPVLETFDFSGGVVAGGVVVGAVAFDVLVGGTRAGVRMRAVDQLGAIFGPERPLRITSQARAPSITSLGSRFGVLLLEKTMDGEDLAQLVVTDDRGTEMGNLSLGAVSDFQQGRTAMRAVGANVVGVWSDTSTGVALKGAVLRCE